jgi:hypothetical protein
LFRHSIGWCGKRITIEHQHRFLPGAKSLDGLGDGGVESRQRIAPGFGSITNALDYPQFLRALAPCDALIPIRAAIPTNSASERVPIFSMTRARWILIVFSAMPRSAAICLLSWPATT